MRQPLLGGVCCVIIATLAGSSPLFAGGEEEVAPGLKAGDNLDQSNWRLAKDLLPAEILRHYERGEYRNKIAPAPAERHHWDADFEAAGVENAKYLEVDERGTIIDKRTGKQPAHLYGIPFPHVGPDDPNAGTKVGWNNQIDWRNSGNSSYSAYLAVLNPKGLDRETLQDVTFLFYDAQGPRLTPKENPLNLAMQFLSAAKTPADINGTAALSWRYRDPDKRDSLWAYVPALRRVRAVSPANRSDGTYGSDISQDDSGFFDGKIEDFTWKLVGQREALAITDPATLQADLPQPPPWKDGGWLMLTDPDLPTVGFRTPGWTGLAWAPTDPVFIKRKVWVVEAVPRDKYYLYGKLELWIDQESWAGLYNRKYAWNGELVQNYAVTLIRNHLVGPPGAQEWVWHGSLAYFCVEALKFNRATCAGPRLHAGAASVRRIPLDPKMFDAGALARFGK
jgi:hypothetical protein